MTSKIAIIGLGSIGREMLASFANFEKVVGIDVSTHALKEAELNLSEPECSERVTLSSNIAKAASCGVFFVCVQTDTDPIGQPNYRPLEAVAEQIGQVLKKGDLVVFCSTVFPGTTRMRCIPILETASKLECGKDFQVGYSPERHNPGDKEHSLSRVTRVVSGCSVDASHAISDLFYPILGDNIHVCESIEVAEAAKILENVQRDVNIAIVNEASRIFASINVNTQDVLAAAKTKWNFYDVRPGLVGGSCIAIDPLFFAYGAEFSGQLAPLTRLGREINEGFITYVAGKIHSAVDQHYSASTHLRPRILLLGATFKPNVASLKNSASVKLRNELVASGFDVFLADPIVPKHHKKDDIIAEIPHEQEMSSDFHCIVFAVAHDVFKSIDIAKVRRGSDRKPLIIDLCGIFDGSDVDWAL